MRMQGGIVECEVTRKWDYGIWCHGERCVDLRVDDGRVFLISAAPLFVAHPGKHESNSKEQDKNQPSEYTTNDGSERNGFFGIASLASSWGKGAKKT